MRHRRAKAGRAGQLAAERIQGLETEIPELQRQADELAAEIAELSGEGASRIG